MIWKRNLLIIACLASILQLSDSFPQVKKVIVPPLKLPLIQKLPYGDLTDPYNYPNLPPIKKDVVVSSRAVFTNHGFYYSLVKDPLIVSKFPAFKGSSYTPTKVTTNRPIKIETHTSKAPRFSTFPPSKKTQNFPKFPPINEEALLPPPVPSNDDLTTKRPTFPPSKTVPNKFPFFTPKTPDKSKFTGLNKNAYLPPPKSEFAKPTIPPSRPPAAAVRPATRRPVPQASQPPHPPQPQPQFKPPQGSGQAALPVAPGAPQIEPPLPVIPLPATKPTTLATPVREVQFTTTEEIINFIMPPG